MVPETLPILTLLERFRSTGTHIAMIVDEHGGFEGLVTLGDMLEELVGEMLRAGSGEAPEVEAAGDGAWLVDGAMHVDAFLDLLSLDDAIDTNEAGYRTVGGLIADRLGRVPEIGDAFRWKGFEVRVERMEGLRVTRVHVATVT